MPDRKPPDRTILFVIDGLPADHDRRLDLPHLAALKREGACFREIALPLPAHPARGAAYPWDCSIPNPVLMAGTVFIGQAGIHERFIQHSFRDRPTAFLVNAWTYADIAAGFDIFRDASDGRAEMLFRDDVPVEMAKDAILRADPVFLRVHCQGPGSAGHRSRREAGQPYSGDIWHPSSPFLAQNRAVDALLGGFVDWLKRRRLWRGTLLIVMGDHGQCAGGGHAPYEPGSAATRAVFCGPGVRAGAAFDYAELTDIAPTIAWFHGVAPPPGAHGRVLSEIVADRAARPPARRFISELNTLLLRHESAGRVPRRDFLTIDAIGRWHETEAGADIAAFVDRQAAALRSGR
jgi:hypothetical protein